MKITMDVPEYVEGRGLEMDWDDSFEILVTSDNDGVQIVANPAGLRSLARHMLLLAQERVPSGHHIHLDENSPLEPGSVSLILGRA
jgi:hypothetical protein